MYYLYILKNKSGLFYVGQTNNVNRRLCDHNNSSGAKFIKDNGEFELVYTEAFSTRIESMRREKQIKGWTRAKKEALIDGNLSKLVELSKNRQK